MVSALPLHRSTGQPDTINKTRVRAFMRRIAFLRVNISHMHVHTLTSTAPNDGFDICTSSLFTYRAPPYALLFLLCHFQLDAACAHQNINFIQECKKKPENISVARIKVKKNNTNIRTHTAGIAISAECIAPKRNG